MKEISIPNRDTMLATPMHKHIVGSRREEGTRQGWVGEKEGGERWREGEHEVWDDNTARSSCAYALIATYTCYRGGCWWGWPSRRRRWFRGHHEWVVQMDAGGGVAEVVAGGATQEAAGRAAGREGCGGR
jgi:hypothetical protein